MEALWNMQFQKNIISKFTFQLEKYPAILVSFFLLTFVHAWNWNMWKVILSSRHMCCFVVAVIFTVFFIVVATAIIAVAYCNMFNNSKHLTNMCTIQFTFFLIKLLFLTKNFGVSPSVQLSIQNKKESLTLGYICKVILLKNCYITPTISVIKSSTKGRKLKQFLQNY